MQCIANSSYILGSRSSGDPDHGGDSRTDHLPDLRPRLLGHERADQRHCLRHRTGVRLLAEGEWVHSKSISNYQRNPFTMPILHPVDVFLKREKELCSDANNLKFWTSETIWDMIQQGFCVLNLKCISKYLIIIATDSVHHHVCNGRRRGLCDSGRPYDRRAQRRPRRHRRI